MALELRLANVNIVFVNMVFSGEDKSLIRMCMS